MKQDTEQHIQDPEVEAKEFEKILKDVDKSITESCSLPGKSGLNFEQFKAHFLKNLSTTPSSVVVHGSH